MPHRGRCTDALTWLALAAMASIMLLAVTNHVTQNIASVPFLWVLPLSIYLASFILTFDHPRGISARYSSPHWRCWGRRWRGSFLRWNCACCYGFLLRIVCWLHVLSRELASMKPDPRWLTRFYLMLSLGVHSVLYRLQSLRRRVARLL